MPDSGVWPRVIKRGPLRGQEFDSQAAYDEARAQVDVGDPSGDSPPGEPAATGLPPARRGRRAKGKVTREMVYAILFPLNIGLWMIPQTRNDALSDEEIGRLCDATVKVAAVNQWVERAILASVESSAYVELAVVVGAIAIKRAANHGYLSAHVGEGVASMFGLGASEPPQPSVPDPSVNGYPSAPVGDAIFGAPGG